VLREFELDKVTVRDRKVGCSPVVRESEFVLLTVGNYYRNFCSAARTNVVLRIVMSTIKVV
jgi:hypothetical protein